MQCPHCGYAMTDFDTDCPRCARQGHLPTDQRASPLPDMACMDESPRRAHVNIIHVFVGLLIGSVFASTLLFGLYHVVSSSEGTAFVRKVHFTYAETFVSLDAMTGVPYIKAKERWPLTVKALQRDGVLESDKAFQERIRREAEEQFKHDMRERMNDFPY